MFSFANMVADPQFAVLTIGMDNNLEFNTGSLDDLVIVFVFLLILMRPFFCNWSK